MFAVTVEQSLVLTAVCQLLCANTITHFKLNVGNKEPPEEQMDESER